MGYYSCVARISLNSNQASPDLRFRMGSTLSLDSACREFLAAHQNADGGWGFHPGAPSAVEATAWTVLALDSKAKPPELQEKLGRAHKWLLQAQLEDGSWPALPGQPTGCWV